MSDTVTDPIDLGSLTDDEVMNLGPDQIQQLMDQEDAEYVEPVEEPAGDDPAANTDAPSNDGDPDADATAEAERVAAEEAALEAAKGDAPSGEDDPNASAAPKEDDQSAEGSPEGSDTKPADEGTPAKAKEESAPVDDKTKKKEEAPAEPAADTKVATDFYAEITKPFKADGKEFQVKSSQEAIRLMQMGANYSRRMQEMKPLKAMDAVLKEHGLDDPAKLAQLIDIQKGDPAAIQKLLKDKGIDPLDIDTSKDATYAAKPYTADEKALNFKDAIDTTLAAPGGKELIADMHKTWDAKSKDALYESPAIFENLLSQQSAVDSANVSDYSKINAEVERQRVLGYLTDVPFLQAYTQVSNAMENVEGLLTTSKKTTPEVPKAPIDTGIRKAALKPKTEQPNPNLSSTPPKAAPTPAVDNETDYSALSDEDFLKLGAPG